MTSYTSVSPQKLPKFAGIKTYMRLPHMRLTEGIDYAIVWGFPGMAAHPTAAARGSVPTLFAAYP